MNKIDPIKFWSRAGPFREFSNFAAFGFEADGVHWPTVEHYFQAQKFEGPGAAEFRELIRTAASPKEAKRLAWSGTLPIRPDWDSVRDDVMRHALSLKFANPVLRDLLLSSGNRPLIEDSPFDRYWGAGKGGRGKNRLGVLLMELRDRLRIGLR